MHYLEFEKPLAEIEGKAEELRAMARGDGGMDVSKEAEALDRKAETLLKDLYRGLSPWQKCQVARHPERPHCKEYIDGLFTEYTPLAGDRAFADDHAIMGGLATTVLVFRSLNGRSEDRFGQGGHMTKGAPVVGGISAVSGPSNGTMESRAARY